MPTQLGSDFGALGHLRSQNDVITYIMVEADSLLKVLHASILDINTVFEHIDMLSMDIQ